MAETVISDTLAVPGADLYYEVRGSGPVLLLLGLPMDSAGFAALAPQLAGEHTVVSYDPRGLGRSTICDPEQDAAPELIADDVHRLIAAVGGGPVDVFGSSGGATTGLALVAAHPGEVRTLVAHEPPVIPLLPDAAQLLAETEEIYAIYRGGDMGQAFMRFMKMAGMGAPPSSPGGAPPGPPSDAQRAAGERFLGHCLLPLSFYRPGVAALRAAGTRIVVGVGAASAGQLAHRAAVALAGELGVEPVEFPGDHGGFMADPAAFAQVLRGALAG
jgi:clorobiocin biosynthesis protein CloN7